MQVLKIVAEGLTTSFRRPHFMWGIQPTYQMPPPATIYGHLCSALGDLISPAGIAFAYRFTAQRTFSDIEHTHVIAISSGKLEGTKLPKVLEGGINPFKRELLFKPRLTLYVNKPEWIDAFRRPRYAVVLGRSQDLFTYSSVEVIELQQEAHAYFEHTLLPYAMATQVDTGIVELLPRYVDYEHKRTPTFARYLLLDRRVHSDEMFFFDAEPPLYWVDPTSQPEKDAYLGLIFHTFTGGDDETFTLA